jgi:dTDP-4-dehydrorhamnose reductase
MRVLIIGANGQLGRALTQTFSKGYEVVQAVHRQPAAGQIVLELEDPVGVLTALNHTKPEVILLAGAFCHVDLCETEWDTCRRVNVEGPQAVAWYVRNEGGCVVYYSTDQVFDGMKDAYSEADPVAPLNRYAKSKAKGEAVVRAIIPDRCLILRTAWLYGPDVARKNFILRLIKRLSQGEDVAVPHDQWGTPTYSEDLARATRYLVERGDTGTYHAVGPDFIDRVSLARKVCARFGLDERWLIPMATSDLGQAAPRPLRVRLDCQKLRGTGAPPFRSFDAGLEALQAWLESSGACTR